jgi:hypothetical protein
MLHVLAALAAGVGMEIGSSFLLNKIFGNDDEANLNQNLALAAMQAQQGSLSRIAEGRDDYATAGFVANTLSRPTGLQSLAGTTANAQTVLSLLGPRAIDVAAIARQSRPSLVEMVAGARAVTG